MDIKVKEVSLVEEKSVQEVESDLLKKHEENFEDSPQNKEVIPEVEDTTEVTEKTPSLELNDESVLSYIKNRYDKEINSVDELFAQTKDNDDLPEDVSAYFQYKKDTGRGIEDFVNLQKDYSSMNDDQLLANYYSSTEEGLDNEDIQDLMDDKFSYDEDLDDAKQIKKIKLSKKRELAKAKKFLNEQKDKYKIPLESSGGGLSEEQEKNLSAYKSYIEKEDSMTETWKKKNDWFTEKTNEVFNDKFKGFEFNVGDKDLTFKPGDANELKNLQLDIVSNFVNKYVDESGLIKDAQGYHRALSMAMHPDKFAQFFYDQGVSSAVDNVAKKSKNIDMDVRQTNTSYNKDGLKIRSVGDTSSGKGLRIKSIKKV